jgi:hypothetical protein
MALHSPRPRGQFARLMVRIVVASVTAAALMGISCSPAEKKAVEDTATRIVLPKVSTGLRYVAETHPAVALSLR